jgi:hypothetical protein
VPRALPGLVVLACIAAGPAARAAQDGPQQQPAPPPAPEDESAGFDIAFGGGALVPQGDMAQTIQTGLDVGGRVGWSSRLGLGLVLSIDYAPLRVKPVAGVEDTVGSHLFTGSLAPRLVLGKSLLRVWLSAGAGVLVERTQTTPAVGSGTTTVESGVTVGGQGGLDLLFFDSGGLSVSGGYTRGLASVEKFQYMAFTAGLVFTL